LIGLHSPCGRLPLFSRAAEKITGLFLWLIRGMPMVVLPELADPKIRFTVKYSEENERAGIVAAYNGPPIDLDAVKNELPMTLLKSAVSSMEQMIVPDDEPGITSAWRYCRDVTASSGVPTNSTNNCF